MVPVLFLYIQSRAKTVILTSHFQILTSFPRKDLSLADKTSSLASLKLCPQVLNHFILVTVKSKIKLSAEEFVV
jgi:hypothetical protein